MVSPGLVSFFSASVGAGAALIGLIFVAVSIAPEKTVMVGAPLERQANLNWRALMTTCERSCVPRSEKI